jgi:butyryl-CoA dehydrogenase
MEDLFLTEDERLIRSTVRDLADRALAPRAADYDEAGEFPWDNIRDMADLGLFGLTIDEEYGGSGGTARQLAITIEEVARGCAATSVIYLAHLSLCAVYIQMYGTEGQKRRFIPQLANARKIGAFALTEPGAGSDSAAISTTAARKDGHYVLNGAKLFTTNGDEADTFVVLATQDASLRSRGVVALIVERESEGFTVNPQHGKMGVRASSTAELVFEDCPVPVENRLGPEGEGFRQTMQMLNCSRIGIAAQCVGIAQAAYEAAVSYAKQRQTFGKQIAEHQAVQWMIADMATEIDAARLLVLRAATLMDRGEPFAAEASKAKLFASEAANRAAHSAVQIHGGVGYFAPTPAERLYRDARVTEIYEGSSEVQRLIIARTVLDL